MPWPDPSTMSDGDKYTSPGGTTYIFRAAENANVDPYYEIDRGTLDLVVLMPSLPVADPGNPGQLYHIAGDVKVSL